MQTMDNAIQTNSDLAELGLGRRVDVGIGKLIGELSVGAGIRQHQMVTT